jgi:uncharacterized membrane protein (UPF0182 family)
MTQRARWLVWTAVVAVPLVLLGGRWLAIGTVDALWADALGVAATHAQIRNLQSMLLLTAVTAAGVWCVGNLYLVYRSIGSVHVPRRLGNLEILEVVPQRYLLVAAAVLGALLALAFSHGAASWWHPRMLAGHAAPLGVTDPVLGKDVGHYLFRLPWQRTVHTFVTLLSGTMLGVTSVLYAAVGAIRWTRRRRLRVSDLARWHLAGLLTAFALALFWGYRLEPVEYVAGVHDVPVDTVLTAVRIPVARMLSVLAIVAAAGSLVWMWGRRMLTVAIPWALLAAASFVGHYVAPSFAAAVRAPEEMVLPEVEAVRREFLREAFAAGGAEVELPIEVPPDPAELGGHAAELAGAPVWDAFAVSVLLNRSVPGVPHARFSSAHLGVYRTPEGRDLPVYVAAREIDLAQARSAGAELTWESVHAGEHAMASGAAAVLAHRVSEAGMPLFVRDWERPAAATERAVEFSLEDPTVRFGSAAVGFAVTDRIVGDVVGVPAGGWWRRLALAWSLQSPKILTSDAVSDSSLVLWHRDARGRLERLAPFARFGAPHAVVSAGRLYWLASGYVWAGAFPLSRRLRWRGEGVRYLRSGLIGVVDAASGRSEIYLRRDADPLSEAWGQLAPEVVRPAGQLPAALARHVRYPQEQFALQLGLLHEGRTAPVPAGLPVARVALMPGGAAEPYWWVGTTPADPVPRLRLMAALETGEAQVLAGVADGSVREGSAVFDVLRVAPDLELPGPSRTGRLFRRLRGEPAGVQGALRLAPFRDGVLALQASYVSPDDGQAPPQLADVALGWGGAVGSGPTLETALRGVETQTSPFGMAASQRAEARRWFERMDAARRSGDWTAFGRAYEELRRILTGADSVP